MEHSRKQKLLIILILVISIASLSVGFAAFSTTLNISSSASVNPSSDTFSVKLLSMYNLYVGQIATKDLLASTPITNPTGLQDSRARGWV